MASKPNILFIMTDQHHPSIAGFAGDPVVRTQHLDRLAERSVQFKTAVCASPVCTPSRMCLLTGKESHRCAGWNNHWVIFPEHITWPGHLAEHGYTTCLVGKMHFGGRDQMNGFQHRPYGDLRHGLGHQPEPLSMFPAYNHAESAGVTEIPDSLHQDVIVTRETLAFLLEHADTQPDKPWFMCASYCRPHSPLTAPGRYIRRYRDAVPAVELPHDWLDDLEPYTRELSRRYYASLPPEQHLRGREAYYACIDFVDDCIGELLDALQHAGLLENTIVVYTSDHGDMACEHGLWGKGVYYEAAVGVPLLITGPGVRSGRHTADHVISLMDLFPTCCTLAGLPIPEGLDGIDFGSVLADPDGADPPRDFAPSQYFMYGVRTRDVPRPAGGEPNSAWRSIRTRRWKYVDVQGGESLLFDMIDDPGETANLAGQAEHAELCRDLRKKLFEGFSWDQAMSQLDADRQRLPQYLSGLKPTTPNQYMLPDGRVFDAEAELYAARWLAVPCVTGGIIPQQFG